jgi:hypothetical protein
MKSRPWPVLGRDSANGEDAVRDGANRPRAKAGREGFICLNWLAEAVHRKTHCGRFAVGRAMVNPLQWRFEWRNAAYLVFSFR